jgi:putative redox protein
MPQTKSSKAIWRGDLMFTAFSSNGFSIPLDSAESAGGHGTGASPIELLLTALAGCSSMDVVSILQKKKQQLTAFEIQVDGIRADDHPRIFTEIKVHFRITGHKVEPTAVERAIQLSDEKYCSVAAALHPSADIHYTYEIIEAEAEKR